MSMLKVTRDVAMHPLSEYASFILDRMEPARRYEPQDLHAFIPDTSIELIREIMHELWINRQVERDGYSGWRRHQSAPPDVPPPAPREIQIVKPEELFDHGRFEGFFK